MTGEPAYHPGVVPRCVRVRADVAPPPRTARNSVVHPMTNRCGIAIPAILGTMAGMR